VSNHTFCLTTGDAMLANMFVFMCSHGSSRPVTPKLWLVLSAQQRSFLYGMNDIVQVGRAAPTRVINVSNTNRSNVNSKYRPTSVNINNQREGSGNSNNLNAKPGLLGRNKKQLTNSYRTGTSKLNNNTTSFVTASSNNSNNKNNVTQPIKKRKVNNNIQAKLNRLAVFERAERERKRLL